MDRTILRKALISRANIGFTVCWTAIVALYDLAGHPDHALYSGIFGALLIAAVTAVTYRQLLRDRDRDAQWAAELAATDDKLECKAVDDDILMADHRAYRVALAEHREHVPDPRAVAIRERREAAWTQKRLEDRGARQARILERDLSNY